MTKEEVYPLATLENPVINDNGNKIEFANGDVYAKQSITNLYRKVNVYLQPLIRLNKMLQFLVLISLTTFVSTK